MEGMKPIVDLITQKAQDADVIDQGIRGSTLLELSLDVLQNCCRDSLFPSPSPSSFSLFRLDTDQEKQPSKDTNKILVCVDYIAQLQAIIKILPISAQKRMVALFSLCSQFGLSSLSHANFPFLSFFFFFWRLWYLSTETSLAALNNSTIVLFLIELLYLNDDELRDSTSALILSLCSDRLCFFSHFSSGSPLALTLSFVLNRKTPDTPPRTICLGCPSLLAFQPEHQHAAKHPPDHCQNVDQWSVFFSFSFFSFLFFLFCSYTTTTTKS